MSGLSYYCLQCYKELRPASSVQEQALGGGPADGDNCPHCGLQYNPEDEQTFVSFVFLSPWASYLLALMGCLFGGGFFLLSTNSNEGVGWALVLGLPICAGAVLGYSSSPRRFRFWRKMIVALLLGAGFLIMASLIANFFSLGGVGMGTFCLVMLGLVFILPFFFGDWLGYMIRRRDERKQRGWPWKGMKIVIFLLLPFGLDAIEGLVPRAEDLAFVETQAVFSAPLERSWDSIVFYEQIEHQEDHQAGGGEPAWLQGHRAEASLRARPGAQRGELSYRARPRAGNHAGYADDDLQASDLPCLHLAAGRDADSPYPSWPCA